MVFVSFSAAPIEDSKRLDAEGGREVFSSNLRSSGKFLEIIVAVGWRGVSKNSEDRLIGACISGTNLASRMFRVPCNFVGIATTVSSGIGYKNSPPGKGGFSATTLSLSLSRHRLGVILLSFFPFLSYGIYIYTRPRCTHREMDERRGW